MRDMYSAVSFSFFFSGFGGERSLYRSCAALNGPRLSARSTISIILMSRSRVIVSTLPGFICRLALLILSLSTLTFPDAICFCARLLVLKNRACHSHLSILCVRVFSVIGYFRLDLSAANAANGLSGSACFSRFCGLEEGFD